MKRWFLLLMALLLAACSNNSAGSDQVAAGPTPTLRVVMQATDPTTFEIASGQPQLVDFFAFW